MTTPVNLHNSTESQAGPHRAGIGTFWGTGVTFDVSAMCIIFGGFANSTGDHLAATAMSRMPAGVAFPVYLPS
jgi:hypothetical protein